MIGSRLFVVFPGEPARRATKLQARAASPASLTRSVAGELSFFLPMAYDWDIMKLPVWKPLYRALKALGLPVEWEVSVGAAVYRESSAGRAYLLLQYLSGHFDFPKGHIESGETEEMTLRRETNEETGIVDLRVLPFRSSIRYFYRAHGTEAQRRRREGRGTLVFKVVHFYPAETKTEPVTLSHEHRGFVWLPYPEALEKLTFENAKRVLRESEAYLEGTKS